MAQSAEHSLGTALEVNTPTRTNMIMAVMRSMLRDKMDESLMPFLHVAVQDLSLVVRRETSDSRFTI
jgi:hypothetical protein